MRLLVQSLATGRFLVPSLVDGTPEWVAGLRDAGGGIVRDADAGYQLIEDHCDADDCAVLVDLDRLGSCDDYAPAEDECAGLPAPAAALRSGVAAGAGVVRAFPDGNHGDNDFSGGTNGLV